MKYFFIYIMLLCCVSCKRDYSSQYTATIINNTTHSIKILFFKSGIVAITDTIKLNQNQQIEIANGNLRGNVSAPGFTSNYFGDSDDSVIVVFDNLYKISHYANTPIQKASKYYLYNSPRNILNVISYRFVSNSTDNNTSKNEHYYEFKEKDYLDAL